MSRKMKDSGIEWIGEIPEDWEVTSVKSRYKLVTGFTPDTGNLNYYDDNGYVWVNISDLSNERYIYDSNKKISKLAVKECKGNLIKKGSLLYSFKLSVGQVAFAGNDLYTNEAIASFIEDESINLNFFYYMSSFAIIQNANENIYGAKLLNQQLIKNAKIVFPPLNEQQAISNFLDQKVSEIDHILKKTRESIEEYKKYKQSLITEAVTKGLNPDVEMKDSGIEWIGEIPKHWEVKPCKYVANLNTGKTPPTTISRYFNGDITWYKPGDFNADFRLNDSQDKLTTEAINDRVVELNPENTVYFVGVGATVGKIGYSKNKAFCNQQVTALVAKQINSEFLLYLMQSANVYIQNNALYTTLPIINNGYLGSIKFSIPPLIEQIDIVKYINCKLDEINSLISQKEPLLSELETYKKSLIYECVTGKRKVD